jgi:hypothetical protein
VADVEPEDGELTASFDGRLVTYGFGELDRVAGHPRRRDACEPGLGCGEYHLWSICPWTGTEGTVLGHS